MSHAMLYTVAVNRLDRTRKSDGNNDPIEMVCWTVSRLIDYASTPALYVIA